MAALATTANVDLALRRAGHYRVTAAQHVALEGEPDGISGSLLLALGCRETWLQNINNPAGTDRGCFQISDLYHAEFLASQPGCPVGSWRVSGERSALERGYCPRFTPALLYALDYLQGKRIVGLQRKVRDPIRFAIAAYNAGVGGALAGESRGDVDKFTTGGDYSRWVLDCRGKINSWLGEHDNWRVEA